MALVCVWYVLVMVCLRCVCEGGMCVWGEVDVGCRVGGGVSVCVCVCVMSVFMVGVA